jgi:hypothetical protein
VSPPVASALAYVAELAQNTMPACTTTKSANATIASIAVAAPEVLDHRFDFSIVRLDVATAQLVDERVELFFVHRA